MLQTWHNFEILSSRATSVGDNFVFELFCRTKCPAHIVALSYSGTL
jgi:hypothetical protein